MTGISFTGNYSENFNSWVGGGSATLPTGWKAYGLAGNNVTFVNGTPIARGCAENGIVNGLLEMIGKYF